MVQDEVAGATILEIAEGLDYLIKTSGERELRRLISRLIDLWVENGEMDEYNRVLKELRELEVLTKLGTNL